MGQAVDQRRIGEGGEGFLVKTVDRKQHPVKTRPEEVFALGKQVVERRAAEFESAIAVAHAERHVGLLRGDAELAEESGEEWISRVVKHHEAGVDGHRAPGAGLPGGDRVGVATDVVGGLEQREADGGDDVVGQARCASACLRRGGIHRRCALLSPVEEAPDVRSVPSPQA